MRALIKVAAFILVFSGIIFLLDYGIQFVLNRDPDLLLHHGVGQVTFYLLFVLNVFVFQKFVNKESFLSLGLKPYPGWFETLLRGWAAGVFAFIFYSALMVVFNAVDIQLKIKMTRIIQALFVPFTAFAIATTEEILFRGFFFQTLLKDLPKWPAIIITGILFVLFHDLARIHVFWTVPKYIMLGGGLFCLNVLLCFAYLKTGSLFLPIGVHSGLVFAKVFFRQLKFFVTAENSYLWGSDGDARRGIMAWLLFLAGIFVLKFLIVDKKPQSV